TGPGVASSPRRAAPPRGRTRSSGSPSISSGWARSGPRRRSPSDPAAGPPAPARGPPGGAPRGGGAGPRIEPLRARRGGPSPRGRGGPALRDAPRDRGRLRDGRAPARAGGARDRSRRRGGHDRLFVHRVRLDDPHGGRDRSEERRVGKESKYRREAHLGVKKNAEHT